MGGSPDGVAGGRFNFGESYDFKALHFEKYKPQMNPCERRFIVTQNTDDTDLTDFHRYEIRVYPRHPRNPRSIGGAYIYHYLHIKIPAPICFWRSNNPEILIHHPE
ncbi:MAG: hypothetical protein V1854_02675 [Methanobacteriota archaeon]